MFKLVSNLSGEIAFKSKSLGDVINFARKTFNDVQARNWNIIEYEKVTLEKEIHRQSLVSLLQKNDKNNFVSR